MSKRVVGLVLGVLLAGEAWAFTIAIDGSLPSDLETNSFTLVVKFTNVQAQELCGANLGSFQEPGISDVKIGAGNVNPDVQVFNSSGTAITSVTALQYNATPLSVPDVDATACSNTLGDISFTITYRVEGINPGELIRDVSSTDNNLTVALTAFLANDRVGNERIGTLKVDVTAPNAAPELTAVEAGNELLRVKFTPPGAVDYRDVGNATVQKTPTLVYAVAIEREGQIPTLPGMLHTPGGEDTANNSCMYSPLTDGAPSGTCIIGCEENVYLAVADPDEDFQTSSFIGVGSGAASKGQVVISNLKNDTTYDVFLMYEANGLKRSACFAKSPVQDFTLTELNGAKPGEPEKFLCMIATAAYGSALHEDLIYFRWFRDTKLETSDWGRKLVDYYYDNSTPVAQEIAGNELLRVSTRASLWPVAQVLKGLFWLEHGRLAERPE